jgi:hypothetical protein
VLRDSETEINSDVKEYADLVKRLLGALIAQSCEMAALVFRNYCIEEKSVEEMSKEFNVDEEAIQLMVKYYIDNFLFAVGRK